MRNAASCVSLPSCSTVGSILVSEEEECVFFFIVYPHLPARVVLLQVISLIIEPEAPLINRVFGEVFGLYTIIPISPILYLFE